MSIGENIHHYYLRSERGIKLKVSTILKEEFGVDNGSTLFWDYYRELGINCGFFAS